MTEERPPAEWFDDWPRGRPYPGAPQAAEWVAHLARAIDDHVADNPGGVGALAEKSGVPPTTIRELRTGRRWPSLHTAVALLHSLM